MIEGTDARYRGEWTARILVLVDWYREEWAAGVLLVEILVIIGYIVQLIVITNFLTVNCN